MIRRSVRVYGHALTRIIPASIGRRKYLLHNGLYHIPIAITSSFRYYNKSRGYQFIDTVAFLLIVCTFNFSFTRKRIHLLPFHRGDANKV